MKKFIKKSVCLIAAFCLVLSATVTSFAASSIDKGSVKATDSEFSTLCQYAEEFLTDAMEPFSNERNEYHPDVTALAQSTYADCMDIINNATKTSDIGGFISFGGWIFLDLNEDITNGVETLEDLGTYTRDVYNGKSDIKAIRKKAVKKLNKFAKKAKRKDYSDYNWDLLQISKKKAYKAAGGINSLSNYMKSNEPITSYIDCIRFNNNYKSIDPDILRSAILSDNGGDISDYVDMDQPAYSKNTLKVLVCTGQACLDGNAKFSNAPAAIRKEVKGFSKKAKKYESVRMIYSLWNKYNNMIAESTANDELDDYTYSDYLRLSDRMYTRFYNNYKKSDYTSQNWSMLTSILEKYDEKLLDAGTMAKAKKLYKKCFVKLNAVAKKK